MLTVYYGTVKSGKSEELIRIYNNYKYEMPEKKLVVMKPFLDTREDSLNKVATRNNSYIFCDYNLTESDDIKILVERANAEVVFIDEAQFLTARQVADLTILAMAGLEIYCTMIRTDFMSEPFPSACLLLAQADHVREVICLCKCGKKATRNLRLDKAGNAVFKGASVQIGHNYKPVCSTCFNMFYMQSIGE